MEEVVLCASAVAVLVGLWALVVAAQYGRRDRRRRSVHPVARGSIGGLKA
jgi:hypothetical protein